MPVEIYNVYVSLGKMQVLLAEYKFQIYLPVSTKVKNLGYARVGGKRVTSELIDSLAEKMMSLEEDHLMRQLEQREQYRIEADEGVSTFVTLLLFFFCGHLIQEAPLSR